MLAKTTPRTESTQAANAPAKSWRDGLPVHPAADLFPLMPADEQRALGEDVKAKGLLSPIVLFNGELLDGRNRLDAMELVGIKFDVWRDDKSRFELSSGEIKLPWCGGSVDFNGDPYAYVISANIHRRHLTPDQRRELIAKLLKAAPDKSNRQIAETVKASHVTVGAVRAQLEGRGQIDHVERHTDTKGRKQQAHKPPTKDPSVTAIADRAEARSRETQRQHTAADQRKAERAVARWDARVRKSCAEAMTALDQLDREIRNSVTLDEATAREVKAVADRAGEILVDLLSRLGQALAKRDLTIPDFLRREPKAPS